MTIRLTMASSDNPRVLPLKDGAVKPQNIELECVTLDPSTLFLRNLYHDEFDVFEMSISETLLAGAQRRHEMGLVSTASILEPRSSLALSLRQYGFRHCGTRRSQR